MLCLMSTSEIARSRNAINDRIQQTKLQDLVHLKEFISLEFEIISTEKKYLRNATAVVKRRCLMRIEERGGHFKHLPK